MDADLVTLLGTTAVGSGITAVAAIVGNVYGGISRSRERKSEARERQIDRDRHREDLDAERKHARQMAVDAQTSAQVAQQNQWNREDRAAKAAQSDDALRKVLLGLRALRAEFDTNRVDEDGTPSYRFNSVVIGEIIDNAMLIGHKSFALYVATAVENLNNRGILIRYGDGEETASSLRARNWRDIRELIQRVSRFAVDGTWDVQWLKAAEDEALAIEVAWEQGI